MTWGGIKSHDQIVGQFRRGVQRGRLGSTFLFVGPSGIGKRTFAMKLAQTLLCEQHSERDFEPCCECDACQQVVAETHPDLQVVRKPANKSFIPIELLIGNREHRMREGLCHQISLKPFRGGRKIAIIDDADYLNIEGANCLLKTLEEPPPKSMLILIATNEQRQLPTIRSRCQIIRFQPLTQQTIAELLMSLQMVDTQEEAERWAATAEGGLDFAATDGELAEFRQQLENHLAKSDWAAVPLADETVRFVEAAGKDAPARRQRLRRILQFAAEFYDLLMRELSGFATPETDRLVVRQAAAHWPCDAETAAACLERTLDAQTQLESNANLSTLIECWIDDLAGHSKS